MNANGKLGKKISLEEEHSSMKTCAKGIDSTPTEYSEGHSLDRTATHPINYYIPNTGGTIAVPNDVSCMNGANPESSTPGTSSLSNIQDTSPLSSSCGTNPMSSANGISPLTNIHGRPTSPVSSTHVTSLVSIVHGTGPVSSTPGTSSLSEILCTSPVSSTHDTCTSPVSCTCGTSPMSSTCGTSPVSSTHGTSPVSSTCGTSPVSNTRGTNSVSSTNSAIHVSSTCDTSPVSSTCGTSPVSSSCGTSPVSSTCGTSSVSSSCGTSPVSSTCGTSPVSSTCGTSPVSSSCGTSPVSSTCGTSTSPVSSTHGTSPVSSTCGTSPVSNTRGTNSVSSTNSAIRVSSTCDTSPVSSTCGTSPVSSTNSVIHMSSTHGTNPVSYVIPEFNNNCISNSDSGTPVHFEFCPSNLSDTTKQRSTKDHFPSIIKIQSAPENLGSGQDQSHIKNFWVQSRVSSATQKDKSHPIRISKSVKTTDYFEATHCNEEKDAVQSVMKPQHLQVVVETECDVCLRDILSSLFGIVCGIQVTLILAIFSFLSPSLYRTKSQVFTFLILLWSQLCIFNRFIEYRKLLEYPNSGCTCIRYLPSNTIENSFLQFGKDFKMVVRAIMTSFFKAVKPVNIKRTAYAKQSIDYQTKDNLRFFIEPLVFMVRSNQSSSSHCGNSSTLPLVEGPDVSEPEQDSRGDSLPKVQQTESHGTVSQAISGNMIVHKHSEGNQEDLRTSPHAYRSDHVEGEDDHGSSSFSSGTLNNNPTHQPLSQGNVVSIHSDSGKTENQTESQKDVQQPVSDGPVNHQPISVLSTSIDREVPNTDEEDSHRNSNVDLNHSDKGKPERQTLSHKVVQQPVSNKPAIHQPLATCINGEVPNTNNEDLHRNSKCTKPVKQPVTDKLSIPQPYVRYINRELPTTVDEDRRGNDVYNSYSVSVRLPPTNHLLHVIVPSGFVLTPNRENSNIAAHSESQRIPNKEDLLREHIEYPLPRKEGSTKRGYFEQTCISDICLSMICITDDQYPDVMKELEQLNPEESKVVLDIAKKCREKKFEEAKEIQIDAYELSADSNRKYSFRGSDYNRILLPLKMKLSIHVKVRCKWREKVVQTCDYIELRPPTNECDSGNKLETMVQEYFHRRRNSIQQKISKNCKCGDDHVVLDDTVKEWPPILPLNLGGRLTQTKLASTDVPDTLRPHQSADVRYILVAVSLFHESIIGGHYSGVLRLHGKRYDYDSYTYDGNLYEHSGDDPDNTCVTGAYYVRESLVQL